MSALAFYFTGVAALYVMTWWRHPHEKYEYFGHVGDAANVLGPVAFIMAILTIWEQREQFSQTKELTSQQAFESTFYSMLEHLRDTIEDLRLVGQAKNAHTHGSGLTREIRQEIYELFKSAAVSPPTGQVKAVVDAFSAVHDERYDSVLVTYFRLFEVIVEHIVKNSWLSSDENLKGKELQMTYFRVLRAHISQDEVFLLSLFLLTPKGRPLRELLVKSRLPLLEGFDASEFDAGQWVRWIKESDLAVLSSGSAG